MALFGSFETEREVYSDPIYTVYSARKRGEASWDYAVKLFRLPATGPEAESAVDAGTRDELQRQHLSRITVQQTGAAASAFIAQILERGQDDRGVWYVTRFYPRSVNKMMSGKVALPRASLEHLIRSISQGALDLKHVCGRSHGDIRPTNVQVSKSEKLVEAEVVLSDPMPGGSEEGAHYEANDLHSIGEILLQLVRQRVLSSNEIAMLVPIALSADWTRVFGKRAGEWLALCNRLLDPDLSPDQFGLAELVASLEQLRPKRGVSPKLVKAGAVALLIIGAVGFWSLRPRRETVEVTSNPSGATILVDSAKQSSTTPAQLKLKAGPHTIEVRHEVLGLSEEATNWVVQSGTPSTVHFQLAYGSVAIKSQPPGATILKHGVALGRTTMDGQPFVISNVAPGLVAYQLKLEQYEPADVTGFVRKLARLELSATLNRSETVSPTNVVSIPANVVSVPTNIPEPARPVSDGTIELRAAPGPALIIGSDGKERGRAFADTPLKLPLAPGKYSFTARMQGLDDVVAELTVESGVATPHTFAFDFGTVEWVTEPVPATVSLGDQSHSTPASFIQKPGVPSTYVIAAPGYVPLSIEVTVKNGERKSIRKTLQRQIIPVELVSDPPGAQFLGENGAALTGTETNKLIYYLPWGPTNLVARHATLGLITNHVELTPDGSGSRVPFRFDYGMLVLTNLPPDVTVYEGQAKVGSAADQLSYQKPGGHVYALRGKTSSQELPTSIRPGLNFLTWFSSEKTWKNGLGMWFAWVPNLPGGRRWPGQSGPGGWVGITEVTQGQYKKMDGSNPSFFREDGDNYPVENLTLGQAMGFCDWLSSHDTAERLGWHYTLPTDEQFVAFAADADRVARVTSEGKVSTTQDDIFSLNRGARIPAVAILTAPRTHPEMVGSTKQPNQFGLYDVAGNLSEWIAGSNGKENVCAGGSYLTIAARSVGPKARERALEKGPSIGFRVILVPGQ